MNIYFPVDYLSEEEKSVQTITSLTEICSYFDNSSCPNHPLSVKSKEIEKSIRSMIPIECKEIADQITDLTNEIQVQRFYNKLLENCPVIQESFHVGNDSCVLCITTLCESKYTKEVGRFVLENFSKWLVPGKSVPVDSAQSTLMKFTRLPDKGLFFHQMWLTLSHKQDVIIAKNGFEKLKQEIQLNIISVAHARKIMSHASLSDEQKKLIIQDNISELLDISSKGWNQSLFDQMQHLIVKAGSEKKVEEIQETIGPLLKLKPEIYERDLFNEMQRFVLPSSERFTKDRSPHYLSKIISYSYLLRKRAAHALIDSPTERFAASKILRSHKETKEGKKTIIGILSCVNLTSETEVFDKSQLEEAIFALISDAKTVENSFIHNKKEYSSTRILYFEIDKQEEFFTKEEIESLQKNLTKEILARVQSVTNTLFMPRNEEETLRNVVTLNNQLIFPTDLPQVMINYRSQDKDKLLFTYIFVRIESPGKQPAKLRRISECSSITIQEIEKKTVGLIRKKHRKKAYVLEISCVKKKYLRRDYSLDLTRARRDVFSFMEEQIGKARDFNGGMISKQNDVLVELKRQLQQNDFTDDFLVENFFYSFIPRFMQCILPATSLKHSFLFMQEALEHDFSKCIYYIKTITWEKYFIITVSTINQSFKNFIEEKIANLDFDPSSFCSSYTNVHDIPVLSYILSFTDPSKPETLMKTLVEGLKEWKASFTSTI